MKKITFLFFTLPFYFCNAQENISENVVNTSYGSFSSMNLDAGEVNTNTPQAGVNSTEIEHSEKKTRDGGTSTLIRFNRQKKEAIKLEAKRIQEEILKISVYPNPAKGIINVSITDEKERPADNLYTVIFKNLVGQSLNELQSENKLLRIDSSLLPKGFYLVEVTIAEGKAAGVQKVIIQ